ncbi:MAG: sigma-70 family RNA polymerase sigma factor [Alphaproteobacteria bacterium]|nr:sigma-70 family RNA polymerase sigma factor [Alphaproteobacteria bacterium]MBV9370079.1 sigma-70 family RNA polymerase sigma factor [Alphaproteobacteria bacterium]MBV9900753.1 sigma-70 family RNA polymerase sigma factor [Alphaproteobacteria bacterium]
MVLENGPALRRFLAARRVAPDEAEDLLQELYVKLSLKATGPVLDARAYLYRTLDNMIVDRRRADLRRGAREEAWAGADLTDGSVADEPTPERIVSARRQLGAVEKALSALPERTLLVFRRFRLDGATQRDIAAELGISISAVEKHLQRAYKVVADIRHRLDADSSPSRRPPGEDSR